MFTEQFQAAIETVTFKNIDGLTQRLWQAHGAGLVDDDKAQAFAEALAARRGNLKQATLMAVAGRAPLRFARATPQRSPDKARSIGRRRQLAASGPMPPALAANYTVGELAALRIIADEINAKGYCDRSVAEIAARAGVGPSTVRNAVRFARQTGLLSVLERPRAGRKNLTNLIKILSHEWRSWLRKRLGIGFKNVRPTVTDLHKPVSFKDRNGIWRPKGRKFGQAPSRRLT